MDAVWAPSSPLVVFIIFLSCIFIRSLQDIFVRKMSATKTYRLFMYSIYLLYIKSPSTEPDSQLLILSIRDSNITKFVQMMTLSWPWTCLWKCRICSLRLRYFYLLLIQCLSFNSFVMMLWWVRSPPQEPKNLMFMNDSEDLAFVKLSKAAHFHTTDRSKAVFLLNNNALHFSYWCIWAS